MTPAARRILIVEDEPMIASLIVMILEDSGFVVVGPLATLDEALLTATSAEHFDVAIVDMDLHGLSALPVAERLRDRGVPIIFSSGGSSAATIDEFSGSLWLQKPFTLEAIVAAVDQLSPAK